MTETTTVNEYPFTSMIKCRQCGCFYQRKLNNAGTKYQKAVWICSTYNRFGKERCQARQIPEEILLLKSVEVLKLKEFNEKAFKSNIKEIVIPENNSLVFVFLDGNSESINWQYKSRSESWSQEARQKVSEANKARKRG
jgi:hypothetical protein